jgi:hypothetical protein
VKVEFPEKVWGRLASIADNRGVSIAELIVDSASGLLALPRPEQLCPLEHVRPNSHVRGRRPSVDWADEQVADRIRELHRMHRSMAEVARTFGVSDASMRTAYRHLGIVPARSNTNPKEGTDV